MTAPSYAGFPGIPARGPSSNNFALQYKPDGSRYARGLHGGSDIRALTGDVQTPAYPGTVDGVGNVWGPSYGLQVRIHHRYAHRHRRADGTVYTHTHDWWTFYAHLQRIYVRKGQAVTTRTAIGRADTTGSAWGPHDHHELHLSSAWTVALLDPFPRLEARRRYAVANKLAH